MKREPLFKTEADMCLSFSDYLKKYPEWTPYNETAGWDILLVHADGTQVGIQAKLKFNMSVLSQAVDDGLAWNEVGPDYRAILVPEGYGSVNLCDALGLTLIRPRKHWDGKLEFEPGFEARSYQRWHYANPRKRHELPAYIPDVPAGVPSPSVLTKWKVGALEICAVMELRGYVTRHDFRIAGVDHRRWIETWLEAVPERPGCWRWLKGNDAGFSKHHPVIYPQILAKVREKGVAADGLLV